jgi:hypothetical protein
MANKRRRRVYSYREYEETAPPERVNTLLPSLSLQLDKELKACSEEFFRQVCNSYGDQEFANDLADIAEQCYKKVAQNQLKTIQEYAAYTDRLELECDTVNAVHLLRPLFLRVIEKFTRELLRDLVEWDDGSPAPAAPSQEGAAASSSSDTPLRPPPSHKRQRTGEQSSSAPPLSALHAK